MQQVLKERLLLLCLLLSCCLFSQEVQIQQVQWKHYVLGVYEMFGATDVERKNHLMINQVLKLIKRCYLSMNP